MNSYNTPRVVINIAIKQEQMNLLNKFLQFSRAYHIAIEQIQNLKKKTEVFKEYKIFCENKLLIIRTRLNNKKNLKKLLLK